MRSMWVTAVGVKLLLCLVVNSGNDHVNGEGTGKEEKWELVFHLLIHILVSLLHDCFKPVQRSTDDGRDLPTPKPCLRNIPVTDPG